MEINLRDIRKSRNMTQEDLASKAKVARAIISGIESGRVTETTVGTLRKLADALQVPVTLFFAEKV